MNVGKHMIKIADVDPVGDDSLAADLNVQVTLHRVVATKDRLVADSQGALVGIDEVPLTKVNPTTDDEPPVSLARVQFGSLANEDEAFGDHVWASQSEHQESPIPQEVPT